MIVKLVIHSKQTDAGIDWDTVKNRYRNVQNRLLVPSRRDWCYIEYFLY